MQTFWNNKRRERKMKVKDIAFIFNITNQKAQRWFIGYTLPSEEQMKQICDLFEVPYDEGIAEFNKAHDAYLEAKYPKSPDSTRVLPKARRVTFWNKKRMEKGLKIHEVADMLGKDRRSIGMCFTGQVFPSEDIIEGFCKIFNVDIGLGRQEFIRANDEWKADSFSRVKLISNSAEASSSVITLNHANSFWESKRAALKLSQYDLANFLAVSHSTMNAFLTGKMMPNDKQISMLCNLFSVSIDEGTKEFERLYREYHTNVAVEDSVDHVVTKPDIVPTEESDIFKSVYGKIPYDEFMQYYELIASKDSNALKYIYNKVDFHTFEAISQIVDSWCQN